MLIITWPSGGRIQYVHMVELALKHDCHIMTLVFPSRFPLHLALHIYINQSDFKCLLHCHGWLPEVPVGHSFDIIQ